METRKKILVVDDEDINLEFFELMLSNLGFEVEKAKDGEQGLAKAKKFLPDLILLDNIMPKMSGWELTKKLKDDPKFHQIPIIMLSALDDVRDKVEGFELGVDDYITKPFNFSEVLARIRATLRGRELYSQLSIRDSWVQEFNTEIKQSLQDIMEQIKETNPHIIKSMENLQNLIKNYEDKWEALKKNENGLTILEKQMRHSLQEHK